MQFVKKTSSSKLTIITKLIIKIGLVILAIFAIVYLLNRIDFPAPIKEIEKTIPNENLKLLNNLLTILLVLSVFSFKCNSEEPVDIWDLDKIKKEEVKKNDEISLENIEEEEQQSIYEMQSSNQYNDIELDKTLVSKEIEIVGLYDPELNGLSINMWSNSNGDQIINIFNNLNKIKLSSDASEILNIVLLTNSYYPENNITKEKFIKLKSDWLIKNSNLKLIEDYLLKNQISSKNPELTKYLVDEYLSKSNVEKSCEIFSNIKDTLEDEYLSKFSIYCLIYTNQIEKAQLFLDLKKESGFKDSYFENKINFLLGYSKEVSNDISEKTILDFHLSHRTNPEFKYEPKENTSKLIWRYLSSSNLLSKAQDIEIIDLDKISIIEKATHDKNYPENELFKLYRNFQFSIDQLLNIKDSSKLLSNIEGRALIYQGILLNTDLQKKLELMKLLKDSFSKDEIINAFDDELERFLIEIDVEEVPSNFTSFYRNNINNFNEKFKRNIKLNNKILHQSKLINYFRGNYSNKNIEKDLNEFLKKIKRNKKYFFSKKDIILVESLKADGIKVSKKYKNLYQINELDIPTDIQVLINNEDLGGSLLRIVEVIGQDEIKNIDDDTIYFIISALNQLNVDPIRNKLLIKVLPLKV